MAASLRVSLTNQAEILREHGDLDHAMRLNEEVEQICKQLGNLDGLRVSLNNQGLILQAYARSGCGNGASQAG